MLQIKSQWRVEKEYINTDTGLLTKETHTLAASLGLLLADKVYLEEDCRNGRTNHFSRARWGLE